MDKHNGCLGCKYEHKEEYEFPCSHCRGTIPPNNPMKEKIADLYVPDENSNPYWERICALSLKQRAKGMETYGQGLESNPADIMVRIEHLQEELVDALMYCEWIKDKIREMEEHNVEDHG